MATDDVKTSGRDGHPEDEEGQEITKFPPEEEAVGFPAPLAYLRIIFY